MLFDQFDSSVFDEENKENIFFEQFQTNREVSQNQSQEMPPDESDRVPEEEMEVEQINALKKYFLIKKLDILKSRISKFISTQDLDIILKFAPNLSYNILSRLVDGYLTSIDGMVKKIRDKKVKNGG